MCLLWEKRETERSPQSERVHHGGKENCGIWYCRCISESSLSSLCFPDAQSQHFHKCYSYPTASHLQLLLTYTSRNRKTHTHGQQSSDLLGMWCCQSSFLPIWCQACYITHFIMYDNRNRVSQQKIIWATVSNGCNCPILVLTSNVAAGNTFILKQHSCLILVHVLLFHYAHKNWWPEFAWGIFFCSLRAELANMFWKC